jgi:predicted alpha/beta superfamily hydrolase
MSTETLHHASILFLGASLGALITTIILLTDIL